MMMAVGFVVQSMLVVSVVLLGGAILAGGASLASDRHDKGQQ